MRFKRSTLRYGRTPQPVTPYQKAAQVWDERIGSARIQAKNWRLMALGCLGLSMGLTAGLIYQASRSRVTPYVVEIDSKGEIRAVGPASAAYAPTDAQIAYQLARFVEQVRSLSSDGVIVRQNWLKAYDLVSREAAVTLNDYARNADPFARVGQKTVSVEVTSAVRASPSSFQLRWEEKSFENGASIGSKHFTGLFTVQIETPRTEELLRKNPLGLFITNFNWSEDVIPGASQ